MDDKPDKPIAGATEETAEVMEKVPATSSTVTQPTTSRSKLVQESSSSSVSTVKKLQTRSTPSATTSPIPSRESSPIRPQPKANNSGRSMTGPGRTRKNDTQDTSPSRSANTSTKPPSTAATQRALSAASTPNLPPVATYPVVKAPVPQKAPQTSEIKETPRWPVSSRLRSPPPVNKTLGLPPRKSDQEVPSINVRRTSSSDQQEGKARPETETDELLSLPSGMRTPARGASGASSTLETVQEISQPPKRGPSALDGILEQAVEDGTTKLSEPGIPMEQANNTSIKPKPSTESGSDSGGKGEIKMRSAAPPTSLRSNVPAKAYSTNTSTRGKPSGEGSTRNMTVETETVSSIPQVAGGPGNGVNGSIRNKPSTETIRPKKEKKKTARKAPSVTGTGEPQYLARPRMLHRHSARAEFSDEKHSLSPEAFHSQGLYSSHDGKVTSPDRSMSQASRRPSSIFSISRYGVSSMLTRGQQATSKADIFEAKVASAVDEANSSDSEETFVYESNPPEVSDRPRRFHSRTPSATSMASQVDQRNGGRSMMDGGHSVAMKKSMKFTNTYSNDRPEAATGEDDGKGTARSNMGTGRGTTHHHHIGRWGRNPANGHHSILDSDSPFADSSKSRSSLQSDSARHGTGPQSPRVSHVKMAGNGKKQSPAASTYDLDDAADDERTPLMGGGTVRSSRSGRSRRVNASSMRQMERQAAREPKGWCARFAGCIALVFMIVTVILGAFLFVFATSQLLTDVKIVAIKKVLASEQDLIFALQVQARNTNLMAVTIDTSDLKVFAKSKYAGTDHEWWKRPHDMMRRSLRGRQDFFDSPPNKEDPSTNPNLDIGDVYELYSPLIFNGSPFKGAVTQSQGELRVDHPGNNTTPAGSERWSRVVEHEFDLIVRGTLKYNLPMTQKIHSISVEGRVTVKPNAADEDPDAPLHILPL